eukprot:gnl/MRDRNA2_/MRDRNA2_58983_c0_seq1.p1 gnl/MRDRNA2_/MRDRNA2_58983_c0~~gnl/MRDRNA2_/MRDRNA2_58983_c0_seq1.p1  ORF type:complete len:252 (-),score=40.29 gnl/MRDRNA2_/MRDRNA2_58983_c0_seq1:630-1385(-)
MENEAATRSCRSLVGMWRSSTSNVFRVTDQGYVFRYPHEFRAYQIGSGGGQIVRTDDAGERALLDAKDITLSNTICWKGRTGSEKWQRIHEVGWSTLVVMLVGEREDDGLHLKCNNISGELLCSVRIKNSAFTTWLEARRSLAHGLRSYTFKSKVSFVSPLGTMLTTAQDDELLEEILGIETTWPTVPYDAEGKKRRRKNRSHFSVDEMAQDTTILRCAVCKQQIYGTPVTQNGGSPMHFGCIDVDVDWLA